MSGLYGKKLPPAPSENPERASLLPPSAPGAHLHDRLNYKNPSPFCSICGAKASLGHHLRFIADRLIKEEREAELAEARARQS